ncbi:MAG: GIY-YIG nuclease family protein [Elusimicrobiaceae bacterium]|nr:GIY-YIG nuclease family protein [Elusimicrobiaceae bacterium]
MEKGFIYVFTNDAMPEYIKIGITTNIKNRLRELDTTGIPVPFRCHYAIQVEDYKTRERLLHAAFADHRVRDNREFFRLAPERAVAALKAIGGQELSTFDNEMIDEEGKVVDDKELKNIVRSKRFPFKECGIPVGAELVFTRDESKKAHVTAGNQVEYEGQIYSLSSLAKRLLQEKGYNWKAVSGPSFFTYNGDILTDIREQEETDENN